MTTLRPAPVVPVIRTLPELDALVDNIVELQRARADLLDAQERDLAGVRQKYRTPLAELESYLTLETAWAEAWARENPAAFARQRRLDCTRATMGFRATQPRVERASRKWTWSAAAQRLAESAWGARYLRVTAPEVDKEAILADRAKFSVTELREFGLKIVEQERFFITPHGAEVAADEAEWREAA